ncbi:HlyD family type I secretion periplasmic adaptor subunit [Agarivorans sp. Alg241-V36]|uniref:HlyD family type I secretion periplasmic adaptor subunit n=1 Tax=Agarivorans sp. Alg241-V36 TaxID=2305992 RepID=UPI0013D66202|nr:HlyD family type I secretion periplasmic adaptor subunit [Agarivorans sp. Alg241-V36]
MTNQLAWQQQHLAQQSRHIIWLCGSLITCLVVWAALATLDEVIVGNGKVVPSSAISKIQSLEGGIVKQLNVEVGDQVSRGQHLLSLEDTRFRAAFQESEQQRSTLLAQETRLIAELASVSINNASNNWTNQVLVKPLELSFINQNQRAQTNATANYQQRIRQLNAQLEEATLAIEQQTQALNEALGNQQTLQHSLAVVAQEISMLEDVVASGAVAKVELLKLQRDKIQLDGDIASAQLMASKLKAAINEAILERRNIAVEFRTKAQAQLNEVSANLAQLDESQHAVADQLNRTKLVAPIDGTVKDILVRSVGGVIRPGEAIMEIVPKDSQLIIETKIAPKDIGFIRTGLPAMVKFTAFDFVVYGGQLGVVSYVSPDALQDEDGSTYYQAHIQLDQTNNTNLQVIPGMQAMVDILTGEKSVLSYWLKPLLRAKANALREP